MSNTEEPRTTALSLMSAPLRLTPISGMHLSVPGRTLVWLCFCYLCVGDVEGRMEVCGREGWPRHPGTAFERERVQERKLWAIHQRLLKSSAAPDSISPLLCKGHRAPGSSGQAKGTEGSTWKEALSRFAERSGSLLLPPLVAE